MAHSNLAQALNSLQWASVRPIEEDKTPPSDSHVPKLVATIINAKCPEKEIFLHDIIVSSKPYSCLREEKNPMVGIKIIPQGNYLTIIDSGAGMKKADMELGRRAVFRAKGGDPDVSMVNMSMVRETIVTSKHDDDAQYVQNERNGAYPQCEIRRDTGSSIGRGTKIVLELEDDYRVSDQRKYLERGKLLDTVGRYLQLLGWEALDEDWNRFRRGPENVAHPVTH